MTENQDEVIEKVSKRVKHCIESANDQNKPDSQNPFYVYLSHMRISKQYGQTLEEFYVSNPAMRTTYQLPKGVEIKSLGGQFNPVYRVIVNEDGKRFEAVVKLNNQDKAAYLRAREKLSLDKSAMDKIYGGDVKHVAKDKHTEVNVEVMPFMTGGDLTTMMKKRPETMPQSAVYDDGLRIIIGVLRNLGVAEVNGVSLSDLKPGNIYFKDSIDDPKFSDDKGFMDTFVVQKAKELDVTTGYIPPFVLDSDNVDLVEIKPLTMYALGVTMDCYVRGKTMSERAEDGGDLTKSNFGHYHRRDEQESLYAPEFSHIDTSTPEGKCFDIVAGVIMQPSSATKSYGELANLVSNLKQIKDTNEEFIDFIHEHKSGDPRFYQNMLASIEQGAVTPEQMIDHLNERMKKAKSKIPFRKGSEYKRLRAIKRELESQHFACNDEVKLQGKYDQIHQHIQEFRDIHNRLEGFGSDKLSAEQRHALYEDLDRAVENIRNAVKEYEDVHQGVGEDLQGRFDKAYERALGKDGFYINNVLESRYRALCTRRPELESAEPEPPPVQEQPATFERASFEGMGRNRVIPPPKPEEDQKPAVHPSDQKEESQVNQVRGNVRGMVEEIEKTLKSDAVNDNQAPKPEEVQPDLKKEGNKPV